METENSDTPKMPSWKVIIIHFFIIRTILPLMGVLILGLIFEKISAGSWSDVLLTIGIIGVIFNFFQFIFVTYLKFSNKLVIGDNDKEVELKE